MSLGRSFWMLVGSSGLSNLADGVFKVALPLVAVHYTRSPAVVAGLELVRSLPWLVAALPVGALADRLDRRHMMLAANGARLCFVIAPAVALAGGQGAIWLLFVAAAGTGFAEVFYDTAAQSFLPALVPGEGLDRANGRLYAVELGAQEFVGPPLAGWLVGAALALSFFFSAGLWVVALLFLVAIRGRYRSPPRKRTTICADVREGLSFLYGRPILRNMAVMVGMVNLATSATFALLVLFAVGPSSEMGLTEPQFGVLLSLVAAGSVAGGMIAEPVQRRLGRARSLTLSILGVTVLVGVPAVTAGVVPIGAAFLSGGVAVMVWNIISVSFRQRITPDHLLGRVNSAYRLVAWGTRPLGAALGGALGQWLGIRSVFAVMAVVTLTVLIPNRAITEEALSATG